jgi:hypothetical protein
MRRATIDSMIARRARRAYHFGTDESGIGAMLEPADHANSEAFERRSIGAVECSGELPQH